MLGTDLPIPAPDTPERRMWLAVIERWWEDLVGDAVHPAVRAEAEACLRSGYSRHFEFACAVCGLDLSAVRAAAAIAMRRRRSCPATGYARYRSRRRVSGGSTRLEQREMPHGG